MSDIYESTNSKYIGSDNEQSYASVHGTETQNESS